MLYLICRDLVHVRVGPFVTIDELCEHIGFLAKITNNQISTTFEVVRAEDLNEEIHWVHQNKTPEEDRRGMMEALTA
jgi:hypothetical protein